MTNWDPDPGNDQFAQAEAAGFNPYAGPDGLYEDPPARPPRKPRTDRFGTDWAAERRAAEQADTDRRFGDIVNRYDEE
jgi:hypothetical protein